EKYDKMVVEFSRHLGIAFQILNDLKDWEPDSDNKLLAGQDVLAGRPTLLLAMALEGLQGAKRAELLGLLHAQEPELHGSPAMGLQQVARARQLFEQAQVFAKADKL